MVLEVQALSKVLIINDCKFEIMIMKDMLYSLGYDVETSTEVEAVNKVKYSYPDTVIANLIMKEIRGDDLIEKIKAARPETKCILSSCNDIKLDDYRKKKVDAVIQTPIDKNKLEKVLDFKEVKKTNIQHELDVILEKLKDKSANSKSERDKVLNNSKLESNAATMIEVKKDKFGFCPYCGKKLENSRDYSFCPFCGHDLKV